MHHRFSRTPIILEQVKCVVVGPRSYKYFREADPITKQFTKDLRDNGIRIRGYDFTRYTGRGIYILPYRKYKTTYILKALSNLHQSCVFCLYGEDVRPYEQWILGGENGPKGHRVFIDSVPYREFDWQL